MRNILYLFVMFFFAVSCSGAAETSQIVEEYNQTTDFSRSEADLQFSVISDGLRNAVSIDYVSTENSLYIVEQGRNRILKLTTGGIRTDSVGTRGSGDSRFDAPSSIDATNGLQVFVADRNNARIQVFERRLAYLSTITPPSDRQGINPVFFRPEAISVNSFGDIFVYDGESQQILKYDRNGRFQLVVSLSVFDLETPLRSIQSFEDRLYLLERDRGLIHEITAQGGYRGFSPASQGLKAMYIYEDQIWGVTNNDLIVFNLNGRPIHRYSHNVTGNVTGVAVSRSRVFILTANTLKSVSKP